MQVLDIVDKLDLAAVLLLGAGHFLRLRMGAMMRTCPRANWLWPSRLLVSRLN